MNNWYFWVGIIAAVCIAVYMMPQLIKVLKTKDTSGISIAMFIIALAGDLCFVIFAIGILCNFNGFKTKADRIAAGLPTFLANLAALIISAIIAIFKFRNMHRAKKMDLTEKVFCSNYKVNNEAYKLKYGKKKTPKSPKPENTGSDASVG